MAALLSDDDNINPVNPSANYYQVLGVSPTARLIEIKKAFRVLQRQIHPDASKNNSTRSASANLNNAYKILSNQLLRLEYDLKYGFKQKNEKNLLKLKKFKKRRAQKIRENLKHSAQRSRDIESKVIAQLSNGIKLQNCGLLITKARYGLLDKQNRNRKRFSHLHVLSSSKSINITNTHPLAPVPINGINTAKSVGYESEDEIQRKIQKLNVVEYTIDVTEALQCMITHRGNLGGYIEISDGYDKSELNGFYDPCCNVLGERYLEVEYMFNRKYHYIKLNNFEYVLIPNKNHIVTVFDIDINPSNDLQVFSESESDQDDDCDAKTESKTCTISTIKGDVNHSMLSNMSDLTLSSDLNKSQLQSDILQRANSFATFSQVTLNPTPSPAAVPTPVDALMLTKKQTFPKKKKNNSLYSSIIAATSSISSIDRSFDCNIFILPSGKAATQTRSSLAGLKKYEDILKERQINNNNNNITDSGYYTRCVMKMSLFAMVVGAIGGLGYYYVDQTQRKQNKNNNNTFGLFLFGESALVYLKQYWNWIFGNVNVYDNDKGNNNDKNE